MKLQFLYRDRNQGYAWLGLKVENTKNPELIFIIYSYLIIMDIFRCILSIFVIFHYTMITLRRPDLILFNITWYHLISFNNNSLEYHNKIWKEENYKISFYLSLLFFCTMKLFFDT